MNRNQALWLMTAVLLAAAALRLPALEHFPPGLHFDEAANLLLAGDIGLRGARPVFIASYTGKEPLFFYAAGGLMRLLGESIFSLRLTAAFLGLLTVAVTYRLALTLLGRRRIALLAAALLAVSFWHLLFSRLGFRAIAQPLLQGLTALLIYRGLLLSRSGKTVSFRNGGGDLLLGGLFLGLTAYTYLAARLFPLVLLLGFLPLFWPLRQAGRWIRPLGLVLTAAVPAVLPLSLYFMRFPEAFWVRIQQVAPDEAGLTVWQGIWRSLLMVGWRGDPYWRFNLPEMPLFYPLWFALLLSGGGLLLMAFWHAGSPLARSRRLLLLVAPPIMLLPTALATSEILPSNLRAIGMLPFLVIWPAAGLDWLLGRLKTLDRAARFTRRLPPLGRLALLPLAILLLQGGVTFRDYFLEWGRRVDVFYENDGDLRALADFLNQADLPEAVFVAARFDQHPTLAALAENYDALRWLPEGKGVVWPAAGPAAVIFPHSAPPPPELAALLPPGRRETGPPGPDGAPLFTWWQLEGAPSLEPETAARGNFGFAVELLGYDLATGTSGGRLPLTLYWRVINRPAAPLVSFIHVEDGWRRRWAQIEQIPYPTRHWEAGDVIAQQVDLSLPAGLPPNFYRLKIGWFDPETGQQIARFDEGGRYAGTAAIVEDVAVLAGPPPAEPPAPPLPLAIDMGPGLRLLGFEPAPAAVNTGERLPVGVWWWATADLPQLIARYELYDEGGHNGVILANTQPAYGRYPFAEWPAAAFVVDRQQLEIPLDLDPGLYRLQLRLLGPDGRTLQTAPLNEVEVVRSERLFEPPPLDREVDALFGDEIRLLGVKRSVDEARIELTLVWQAAARPAADYTVFVHLLNPDGSCCVWQEDRPPQGGARPTSGWLAGEVVVDRYEIPHAELPAGRYELEVGLYLPESGIRLRAAAAGQPGADFIFLDPVVRLAEEQ